jgi:outer membrane biogenesis lipoprotein LolB
MKALLAMLAAAVLAGCGVETATTAATAASLKKQELEQGQKTMQRAQEKIDAAVVQMQQRASSATAAEDAK